MRLLSQFGTDFARPNSIGSHRELVSAFLSFDAHNTCTFLATPGSPVHIRAPAFSDFSLFKVAARFIPAGFKVLSKSALA